MTLRIFDYATNGWKNASTISVRVAGAWKEWSRGRVRVNGAWEDFYNGTPPPPPPPPGPPPPPPPPPPPALSASVNNATVSGMVRGSPPGPCTTYTTTITASGGTPPYSYYWELASWDSLQTPYATIPTGATTAFKLDMLDNLDGQNQAEFIGRVTDSAGANAIVQVTAVFFSTSLL